LYRFCRDELGIKTNVEIPHLNKTDFAKNHYTKFFNKNLNKAVYEWDQWVIDEYYPWLLDDFE